MPVHVAVDDPVGEKDTIFVEAPLSVWTFVSGEGGQIDGVFPLMPMNGQVTEGSVHSLLRPGQEVDLRLHALAENQRLVGYAGGAMNGAGAIELAKQVDGESQWIAEPLDAAQPIPGVAACWESLDLIIVDAPTLARMTAPKMAALVASGVTFLVESPKPPDALWPWKQTQPGGWMLRYVPAGPRSAVFNAQVYSPIAYFPPGNSEWARWKFVVYGLGITAAMLLLILVGGRRFGVFWALFVAGASTAVIVQAAGWQRKVRLIQGGIHIVGPHITQDDSWAYETSPNFGYSRLRWVEGMHLVLASADQWEGMAARLECFPDGTPDVLTMNLLAKRKVAVFTRRCGPHVVAATANHEVSSPLQTLVKELYLTKGDRIAGEAPGTPVIAEGYFANELWPTVVVQRASD
jgi:hypothetical protein